MEAGESTTRPPPTPSARPGEYIQTTATGNKISRRAIIYGASNIVLGGKCTIHSDVMIRGDLTRVVRATSDGSMPKNESSSSVVIVTGRYVSLGEGTVVRPPCKTYQG
ncbi:dynactin complex protein [Malassezia pachydermatis]